MMKFAKAMVTGVMLACISLAHAGLPFSCMPAEAAPTAAGSRLVFEANALGWFVAWWCPGVDHAQVYAVPWAAWPAAQALPSTTAFLKDPHTQTANQLRLLGDDIDGPRLAPIWRPSIAKILAAKPKP